MAKTPLSLRSFVDGLVVLYRSLTRRSSAELLTCRNDALAKFSSVEVASASPRFALFAAKAELVKQEESYSYEDGLVESYTLTQFLRNEHGEYFMLKSTDAKPYVKHVPVNVARVVLKDRFVAPSHG